MEVRSLLNKIFPTKEQGILTNTRFELVNDYNSTFFNYEGDLYDSDIVRSCIHAIASNAAKLKPRHICDGQVKDNSNLERLLQVRPNPYMNTYDFIYKVVSQLYSSNNSYIYIRYEFGKVAGLYPINYSSADLKEYNGEMYITFTFLTGKKVTIPYTEVIHLRKHFNRHDMFGEEALQPLRATLNLNSTVNQGISNAVKASAKIRGLLKFTQTLRPEDLKKQKDEFVKDYLSSQNDGGIAALDAKADFQQLNSNPTLIDDKQMALIRENILRYFNISESIITSKYTEDEYNAFYSSVIEPIAIQLSLEFTSKIFTEREKGFGNQIVFSAERLTFANNITKANLINVLMPLGLLSINEAREILELSPVDDGDKRLQSLNFVDSSKANEYQVGESDTLSNDEPVVIENDEKVEEVAEDVVGKTLNGAQTQSLLAVMEQYTNGALSLGQAVNIISISIGISKADAKKIIEGLE